MPTKEEMFSDASGVAEHAGRLEALKSTLGESIKRHDAGTDGFAPQAGILKGRGPGRARRADRLAELAEKFAPLTKGLSDQEQSAIGQDLAELKGLVGEVEKDITVASPGNLHPYDLEAPAKILVPRFTPLRNEVPRQKGQGTAREYRRILGYSNAGMGGVNDLTPFFNSESDTNSFGSLSLRRGAKISYAMDTHTANYMEMSLSDLVSTKAQFSNLGFEDSRQLSQMALLWAHLLGEEKAMLWGRGASGSGYAGAVSAPAGTVAAAGTGATIPSATYGVKITANSGGGTSPAQTAPVTLSAGLSVTLGQNIVITMTTEPTGALNYSVYVGVAGAETLQGVFVPNDSTGTKITLSSYVTGGAAFPAADTSSNANAYDGFLTTLSNSTNAGDFRRFNVTYAGKSVYTSGGTGNIGDQPWQDQFAALYANVYADPEEVWVAAPQRRQLVDFLRAAAGTTAGYRIALTQSEATGAIVGGMVTGLVNESSPTSRIVDLRVHPYMPAGCSFTRSVTLPIPDSHISETSAITAVQEYMSVDWPQVQFTYDASTYWYGTLLHYAPKWSACIVGLQ